MQKTNGGESTYIQKQPLWHFVVLCFLGLGFYEIYWFYKAWKYIKERDNLKISPFWRAIFAGIFIYSLSKKVLTLAQEKGYRGRYYPVLITIMYIFIAATFRLPDPYWIIGFFAFIPILPVFKALKYFWQQEQPEIVNRKRFFGAEIVVIVVGGIITVLAIIGTFVEL